jgi:hypothetical protein
MCNIIHLLRIHIILYYGVRGAVCSLHCPSAALTFLYRLVHRTEHAMDITRRTITFVFVRFYC